MSDVARSAGVSLMTVSRVINNKGDVSPETRERVRQVIEDLEYRPSGIARSLATQQTKTIGLVVPDVSNPYFSGIAHGVAEIAYAEGLSVLLCDSEENPEREFRLYQVLEEKRVDGVISCASRLAAEDLQQALSWHSEVVLVNRMLEAGNRNDKGLHLASAGYVISDDFEGARLAVNYLLRRGHTCIGYLAGPPQSYGGRRRLIGYQETILAAGLPLNPKIIYHCPPTVEGGHAQAVELLQCQPDITALFCFNDMTAIGVLRACADLGRRVPEDLAIVGYDDIPMATWVAPALTTCNVPFHEMGRLATQMLIERLQGCDEDCHENIVQPRLVVRASAP
jgi:LacI family transcriptional regulator